jgi:hypothetical protein
MLQEYHHYFIQKIVTGHFSDIRILISWVICNLLHTNWYLCVVPKHVYQVRIWVICLQYESFFKLSLHTCWIYVVYWGYYKRSSYYNILVINKVQKYSPVLRSQLKLKQDAEITSFIDIHYYREFQEYHHYFIQKIVTGHFSDRSYIAIIE